MSTVFNILSANPQSELAPIVKFNGEKIIINAANNGLFNYAISTEFGSIVLKGRFLSEKEILTSGKLKSGLYQLDIFNGEVRFIYSFQVSN